MQQFLRWAYIAFSFGLTTAVSLYLGYIGGQWLDHWLHSEPVFSIAGILMGIAVGMHTLLRGFQSATSVSNHEDEG